MKIVVGVLVAIVAGVILAQSAWAGSISWSLPTTYSDGTSIAASDIARITVTVLSAPDATGTGTVVGTSSPGATSLTATTVRGRYYYGHATLDGMDSADSSRVLFPFKAPSAPSGITITP